jgi:hypothetical protein
LVDTQIGIGSGLAYVLKILQLCSGFWSEMDWLMRDWGLKDENFDIDTRNIFAKKLNLCIHELPSVQFAGKSVHYCIAIRF